jgi:predicted kinase
MIHVVVGPPASGKSTYVDEHAAENEVKVDFDRIAQAFGSGIPHGSVEPFRTVAFAARSAAQPQPMPEASSERRMSSRVMVI